MTSSAVVVCSWGGQLGDTEEAFTMARKVSGPWQMDVHWLVLGALPDQAAAIAGKYGVASIDHIADVPSESDHESNGTAVSFCPCDHPEQFGRRYIWILFERIKRNDVISIY